MISLRKNVYSNSVRSITITKKDGYRKKNICFYLSVANDGCRPSESCRRFQNEFRVNRKAENIVDVIDDAWDKWNTKDDQDDHPKYPPAFALGQRQMKKTMGWSPEVETFWKN